MLSPYYTYPFEGRLNLRSSIRFECEIVANSLMTISDWLKITIIVSKSIYL